MQSHYKLVSLNPDRYKDIRQDQALTEYASYIQSVLDAYGDLSTLKSFKQWLETEI